MQQGAHRSRPQRVLVARPLNTPGIVELLRDGQEAGACYRILPHMVSIDWRVRLAGAERLDDLILGRQEAISFLPSNWADRSAAHDGAVKTTIGW
jgi:hypothetical protein